MFSDHNAIKLEVNKSRQEKDLTVWKISDSQNF